MGLKIRILIDKILSLIYSVNMGIGHQAISLFNVFLENGELKNCRSVIEIGSQAIPEPVQPFARNVLNRHNKTTKEEFISAKDFYFAIGFTDYSSIDADGKRGSLVLDMNKILLEQYKFNKTYDLVTNFGTTEHIFNQKNTFENIHNLTKKDGYIIHILPFEGGVNHCYYNYHPNFFYDIALHNNYEIKGFWYFSTRHTKILKTYRGYNLNKPLKYNNELMIFIDKLIQENKFINSPFGGSSLGVLYKKINNEEFRIPFDMQGGSIDNKLNQYDKGEKSTPNPITPKSSNQKAENNSLNINSNVDHKKQIDEILGPSYWKIILKRIFLDYNFRKKFVAKFLYKAFGYKSKNFSKDSIFID